GAFLADFAHLTIGSETGEIPRFYLNGRNINKQYADSLSEKVEERPIISVSGDYVFNGFETTEVVVADGLEGNIDELRLWNMVLEEGQIRADFKRYLGRTESNLISYIRCDEKAGQYAYDISKVGVEFNKNHARIYQGSWVDDKPVSSQLGILGVTD